jgi:hypothetical protein
VRRRFAEITRRDWFSHSDVLEFLKSAGLTLRHPFVQAHGLLDESAYASNSGVKLLGCDGSICQDEEALIEEFREMHAPIDRITRKHDELSEHAARLIDFPGLRLIANLEVKEVLQLRESGRDYFALLRSLADSPGPLDLNQAQSSYIDAVSRYWQSICDYIYSSRPSQAKHRTRIGVFARDRLPNVSRWASKFSSVTINLGLDLLSLALPHLKAIDRSDRTKLVDQLSFRFLFFSDSQEMAALKKSLPKRMWLSKHSLDLKREKHD